MIKELEFLPFCYYPTTVVFVDDDHGIVESMGFDINRYAVCETFSDPRKALAWVDAQDHSHSFATCVFKKMGLLALCRRSQDAHRHQEISVMLVDYAMPAMNGIDFCEYFMDSGIKRIMLTGEGDHNLAVKAFNVDILDHFILKSSLDLPQLIESSIVQMQKKYFEELSVKMRDYLKQQGVTVPPYFQDKAFIDFFFQFLAHNKISEYYLLNPQASFLLLNQKEEKSYLSIYEETELTQLINHLEKCYQEEPNEQLRSHLDQMIARKSVPLEPFDIANLTVYPASQEVIGNSTFYVAHIKEGLKPA